MQFDTWNELHHKRVAAFSRRRGCSGFDRWLAVGKRKKGPSLQSKLSAFAERKGVNSVLGKYTTGRLCSSVYFAKYDEELCLSRHGDVIESSAPKEGQEYCEQFIRDYFMPKAKREMEAA